MLQFITQQLQSHSLNDVQPGTNLKVNANQYNEDANDNSKDGLNYSSKDKFFQCDIKYDFTKKFNTLINEKEDIGDCSRINCNQFRSCFRKPCEQCQSMQVYVRGNKEINRICFCKSQDFILSLQHIPHGEKRKFSSRHYSRLKQVSISYDSSSDDEVKDLCAKYKCISSSPPINGFFKKSTTQNNSGLFCIERMPSRPSLNLEKMQQKLMKRSKSCNDKNMPVQDVCFEKADLTGYQPIQIIASGGFSVNNLVPVEEPLKSFQSGYVF
ncbi:uncharacterized protein LOC101239518 [Hydra vulgaris]|uniref:Uncharacterized protein LOC101239518 n=1 Tax=Hydra vulgaris TaxID=6087 RepID=A0ABM4CJ28_HYDVU